jgi:hypothetical protein
VVHVQKLTLAFLYDVQGLMDLSGRLCMHAYGFLDMATNKVAWELEQLAREFSLTLLIVSITASLPISRCPCR